MMVRVRLFALAAQVAGADVVEVSLDEHPTIADLRKALSYNCPALAAMLPHFMFAVNSDYAADQSPIPDGAEIACIPPVSGG